MASAWPSACRSKASCVQADWPGYLDYFMSVIFTEPHSTKPFEDGVRYGWATDAEVIALGSQRVDRQRRARTGAPRACPTLVIHGDDDRRVPHVKGEEIHALVPGAKLLTIGGGGHVTAGARPGGLQPRAARLRRRCTAPSEPGCARMKRQRKALFISSPIGLGHAQRDLAIARELRKLQPDLAIDWFTVDPAARYLEHEGERLHPITQRLANESRHFESVAGEHDLQAFFALRTMDEIMAHNFMTFVDLLRGRALRHRDRRRGLGRRLLLPREPGTEAPAVRLPHRLRRLPADGERQRARGASCAPTATPTTSSTWRATRTCATRRSSSATATT